MYPKWNSIYPGMTRAMCGKDVFFAVLAVAGMLLGGMRVDSVYAQVNRQNAPRYSLNVEGLSLSEAFDRLIERAHINLALDIELLENKETDCIANDMLLEDIFACLLKGTNLRIEQLSSGTYIVREIPAAVRRTGTLTGRVTDLDTGEPLVYAHVVLADINTGDVTDSNGHFSFPKLHSGEYRIASTYVGYQAFFDTVNVAAGENVHIDLNMQIEPLVSSPVVVNGLAHSPPSEILEADTVSLASLNRAGTGDVIRSVGQIVGVQIGDALSNVHVQGGGSGDHQYRLDGAPVFVPIPNGGLVGPFSVFALDKFTVYKAGFGVAHGSSLSGIIEAGHRLSSFAGNRLDVQVDPLSANARALGSLGDRSRIGINWMVAGRKSLWSVYRPQALSSHFSEWSAPDLFLLKALSPHNESHPPSSDGDADPYADYRNRADYTSLNNGLRNIIPAERFQDDFDFYDVHAAMRLHPGSNGSIYASAYRGGNVLSDEDVLLGKTTTQILPEESEDLMSMSSSHKWTNSVNQVRYEHILGPRTYGELGVWFSRFNLSQGLNQEEYYDRLQKEAERNSDVSDYVTDVSSDSVSHFNTNDRNFVAELGFKTEITHSFGSKHFVTGGIEGIRSKSDFLLNFQSPTRSSLKEYLFANVTSQHWRLSAYLEDFFTLSEQSTLSAGVRLTYLDNRSAVYAEPRFSFRHDVKSSSVGSLSFRAAVGIFRQYVNQFDIASLNINAVLPSVRFWLPVGSDINPSRSLHASGAFLVMPEPSWRLKIEGYYKWQPHLLVIDYKRATQYDGGLNSLKSQRDLLIGADGYAFGGALSIEKRLSKVTASAQYEYSVAQQRIPNRFDGAYLSVPWNVPHRLTTSFNVALTRHVRLIGRVENSIGRAWAYRDAYYNFLEPSGVFDGFGQYDISDPTLHQLPMITKLDMGISYTSHIRATHIQVRMDLANILSNSNVEEWLLVYDPVNDQFDRVERPLTPFLPSLTVRLGW